MEEELKENLVKRIEEIENGAEGVLKMTKKDYIATAMVIVICLVGMLLGVLAI